MMKKFSGLSVALLGLWLFTGCSTNIHPPETVNTPPPQKFGSFSQVKLETSVIAPEYAESSSSRKAVNKIDELLNQRLKTVFPQLNSPNGGSGKTLVIKPYVEAIKFVGGGTRFWAGAMAGSSAVILRVDYVEQSSGKIIASPKFYSKASAVSGDYSMGGNDNAMLNRIVSAAVDYTVSHR